MNFEIWTITFRDISEKAVGPWDALDSTYHCFSAYRYIRHTVHHGLSYKVFTIVIVHDYTFLLCEQ